MDQKIAHLGFIQAIISRMAGNAFLLKGWGVTLVAAIFALSAKESNTGFILVAYFPVLIFWLMDSYFYWQERLYRSLYCAVAKGEVSSELLTLDATSQKGEVPSMAALFFSKAVAPIHGVLFAVISFVMWVLLPAK